MNENGDSDHDKWQKILWKEQPFSDNYVPKSFLSSLQWNSNVQRYTYSPLVLSALSITQHASVLAIFLSVFVHLHTNVLDPRILVWTCIIAYIFGYVVYEVMQRRQGDSVSYKEQRMKTIKSSTLVFLALIAITPILKTLSEATSSDSIWALSAVLFTINTLLSDYGGPTPGRPPRLTSVLSMNAGISASVVLSSRLKNHQGVFGVVLLAVELFALYPILRKRLQRSNGYIRGSVTVAVAALAIFITASVSAPAGWLLCAVLIMVTFGSPAILVWAQRYKNQIRGPWDVAIPRVRSLDE